MGLTHCLDWRRHGDRIALGREAPAKCVTCTDARDAAAPTHDLPARGLSDECEAILRAENTKGRREERIRLAPLVLQHLEPLKGFGDVLFDWPHAQTFLYEQFREIQDAALVSLPCDADHKHTPACHAYAFHDLRRAFAALNAERLTGDTLQALMRHKSYATTQRYISVARQFNRAVESLYVPELPAIKARAN